MNDLISRLFGGKRRKKIVLSDNTSSTNNNNNNIRRVDDKRTKRKNSCLSNYSGRTFVPSSLATIQHTTSTIKPSSSTNPFHTNYVDINDYDNDDDIIVKYDINCYLCPSSSTFESKLPDSVLVVPNHNQHSVCRSKTLSTSFIKGHPSNNKVYPHYCATNNNRLSRINKGQQQQSKKTTDYQAMSSSESSSITASITANQAAALNPNLNSSNASTATAQSSATLPQALNSNDPNIIGNYRMDKCLGQGTYGKVRLAYRLDNNEKVAVKVIEKVSVHTEKQVARIQREIRFLKLLHHPHIVKVHDIIETPTTIFFVMEYAKGGELFDYIVAHKKLKDKEARLFFRQIVSALDYCHQNSVIHRDLKPENLLLDANKNIKIIDFGFGNTFKPDGLLDTFCGSPFYAAPEMILGKKYEGPEVDLWSLGVILFALLCGHLPFDDENVKDLYKRIATANYKIPDHVNAHAKELISRMICVDPKKRATLEEVKGHRWVLEGYGCKPDNFLPERPILDPNRLNRDIVQRLIPFGFKPEDTAKAFEDPRPNPIKNTYYLLCEMLQREEKRRREERRKNALKYMGSEHSFVSQSSSNSLYSISENNDHTVPAVNGQAYPQIPNSSSNNSSLGNPRSAQVTGSLPSHIDGRRTSTPNYVLGMGENHHHFAAGANNNSPPIDAKMQALKAEAVKTGPTLAAPVPVQPQQPPQPQPTSNANEDSHRRMSMPAIRVNNPQSSSPGVHPNQSGKHPHGGHHNHVVKSASNNGGEARERETSEGMREVNGWFFNVATTSSKAREEILAELDRVLKLNSLEYRFLGKHILSVLDGSDKGPLEFEIEICKVPNLNLLGLHFKRVNGSLWHYKKLCSKILSQLSL